MAKKYRLGTAIKITTVISVDSPDTVKITIEDPSLAVKVTSGTMTEQTNNVYFYIWQSAETDSEGSYTVTIKATKGDYTGLTKSEFELYE